MFYILLGKIVYRERLSFENLSAKRTRKKKWPKGHLCLTTFILNDLLDDKYNEFNCKKEYSCDIWHFVANSYSEKVLCSSVEFASFLPGDIISFNYVNKCHPWE